MEFKEAEYILAIARYKNISKAAKTLYISQPSLSKFLQNMELRLKAKLFDRIDGAYLPTYLGERYLYYAENVMRYAVEWESEFADIMSLHQGRMNLAIPLMRSVSLIPDTLSEFHKRYPHIRVNLFEDTHSVAEHSMEDHQIDLTIYNVHEPPVQMDYEVITKEEIVMIAPKDHPITQKAIVKKGCAYPWVNLSWLRKTPCILLFPEQNTGSMIRALFAEAGIEPNVLMKTRSSQVAIKLALQGMGVTFAAESYYKYMDTQGQGLCFSIGKPKTETTLIAAYRSGRYLPSYIQEYIEILKEACTGGGDLL